jgi:AbrB family looped-hinge helix DNA binding protein
MPTTLTSKGQVTIPKPIRDALHLLPGMSVEFKVNAEGEVVLRRVEPQPALGDRFDAVRGRAGRQWRTAELMNLLRGED